MGRRNTSDINVSALFYRILVGVKKEGMGYEL
jgi:hypothetical protein